MSTSDTSVVKNIVEASRLFGMVMDHRTHGGKFRTVYLSADPVLPRTEQQVRCQQATEYLRLHNVQAELTRHDNPPFYNKNTGKQEDGHPRHGDPLVEIDSVWWGEQEEGQ